MESAQVGTCEVLAGRMPLFCDTALATRIERVEAQPVEVESPYWTEHGAVTVEDPDHWRVVLMPRPLA